MTSKSILLVEDDCHEIDRAMAALSDNGTDCAMIVCRNGEEAIDYLRQRDDPTPSLVLLGLRPCNLDRRKLLLDIKHDPEFHTIPVVVFTAWCEMSDVIACYQLDANAYVVRPVNFSDYAQTLSDVVSFWARINIEPLRASTAN